MKKAIGYISYTHGLDGKVKVVPMINPEEFKQVVLSSLDGLENAIFYKDNDEYKNIQLSISAFNGKTFICKLTNIDNVEQAQYFLKKEIFIDTKSDNYINPESIIGFTAFDNNTKKEIGKVIDYGDYGGGMLIEIQLAQLDNTKKHNKQSTKSEFYLCNKDYIKKIDFDKRMVSINIYDFM
ncbi:MAG: hypothetical protein IJT15_01445 [Rickettsiales bacterium]|nr:hypothetical protein [Rickettsiales bacterium]